MSDEGWRIGVDIGGTFTDVVLWRENSGQMINEKLLTTPQDPSLAVIEGIATALNHAGIDASQLTAVVHGTTLVANALIERKGVLTGPLRRQDFVTFLSSAVSGATTFLTLIWICRARWLRVRFGLKLANALMLRAKWLRRLIWTMSMRPLRPSRRQRCVQLPFVFCMPT